nr:hypothetical protein [Angustibacter aerolatus]
MRVVVEALYDAADDDSATGGPDVERRIWPVVAVVDAEGYRRVGDDALGDVVERVLAGRRGDPGGASTDVPGGVPRDEPAVLRLAPAGSCRTAPTTPGAASPAAAPSSCSRTTAASSSSPRTRRARCTR